MTTFIWISIGICVLGVSVIFYCVFESGRRADNLSEKVYKNNKKEEKKGKWL